MRLQYSTQEENIRPLLRSLGGYLGDERLVSFFDEIQGHSTLVKEIEASVSKEPTWKTKIFSSVWDLTLYRIVNYCLVRAFRPKMMVETGVLHGLTTHFILSALDRNSAGKLISIDYPSYFEKGVANKDGYNYTLPPKREPGWIIPQKYAHIWKLHLGRSVDVLPKVFSENGEIDIFLHDSEHTYETMEYEMRIAWENLRSGGLLIVDNINANTSFFDFCREKNSSPMVFPQTLDRSNTEVRFGLMRKP
jgi:predicted O-methyltransferase YrrM